MKKIMGYTEVRFPDVEIEDEIIPDVVITVKDMIVENGVISWSVNFKRSAKAN